MNTENKEGHWSNSSVEDSEPQPCSGNAEDKDDDAERAEICFDQCLWHGQIHRRMQMMLRLDEKQQLLANRNNTKSHVLDAVSSTVMSTPIFVCFVSTPHPHQLNILHTIHLYSSFLIFHWVPTAQVTDSLSLYVIFASVSVHPYSRGQRCCSDWIATCAWR